MKTTIEKITMISKVFQVEEKKSARDLIGGPVQVASVVDMNIDVHTVSSLVMVFTIVERQLWIEQKRKGKEILTIIGRDQTMQKIGIGTVKGMTGKAEMSTTTTTIRVAKRMGKTNQHLFAGANYLLVFFIFVKFR